MLIPSGACRDIIDIKLNHSSCNIASYFSVTAFGTTLAGDKIITISAHIFFYKILELHY